MTMILIAEDEPPLAEILTYNLNQAGFDTLVTESGATALSKIVSNCPDMVILDWMLPDLSGVEVCRSVREMPDVSHLPILMLTARVEEADRIKGLESGADDYMTKPFSPRELVVRIKALLRRSQPQRKDVELAFGGITLNAEQHKVNANGVPVKLGPTEYRLLKFLMEHPGRVHSRDTLLERVWANEVYVESRTVDVHIRRLRKALSGVDGKDPIRTVRGAGYSLDLDFA